MWTADGAQTGYKEISIKMGSREYYDMLFKENRENHWDDAPGKNVTIKIEGLRSKLNFMSTLDYLLMRFKEPFHI